MIYGLHAGDGVIRYVGRTKYGRNRLAAHRLSATNEDTDMPVHKWMRKYGPENIQMVILDERDSYSELPDLEEEWIDRLGTSVSSGGLNVARGRGGSETTYYSPETRARMSESAKRRIATESAEDRQRRLDTLRANGQSRPFLGRKHSNDSIAQMRASKLGRGVGETNGNSKLTDAQRDEIVTITGMTIAQMADKYEVSKSTISNVRRKWKRGDI